MSSNGDDFTETFRVPLASIEAQLKARRELVAASEATAGIDLRVRCLSETAILGNSDSSTSFDV
jgi:hypothetical protein